MFYLSLKPQFQIRQVCKSHHIPPLVCYFQPVQDADVEADGRETVTTGLRIHDGFERRSSPGKDVFYSCKRIIGLRWVVLTC